MSYLHLSEVALGEKWHEAFGLFSQHGHHVHQQQTGHRLLRNHGETLNNTGRRVPG